MKRSFPGMFESVGVRPVDYYSAELAEDAAHTSRPPGVADPTVVLLTPGRLQQRVFRTHLSRAADGHRDRRRPRPRRCATARVFMRTTKGLQPVHVIYRRIDDDFLDPTVFRKDSMLGVPGPGQRLSRGQRVARQFHRHRRGGRQGDVLFRAAHDQVLPRPGADPAECADVSGQRGGGPQIHPGASGGTGGEGGQRIRRLRHVDGAEGHQGGDRDIPRADQSPIRAITSRSR